VAAQGVSLPAGLLGRGWRPRARRMPAHRKKAPSLAPGWSGPVST
jgi:hypothetical protein